MKGRYEFENGFGASVIGDRAETFEVAVLHDDSVCYNSGITSDVLRFQSAREVLQTLLLIEALGARSCD